MSEPETRRTREWYLIERGWKGIKLYDERNDEDVDVTIADAVAHATLAFEPRTFRDCLEEGIIDYKDVKLMAMTGRDLFDSEEAVLKSVVTIDLLRKMAEGGTRFPFRILLLRPWSEHTVQSGLLTIDGWAQGVRYLNYVKGGDAEWYDPVEERGSVLAVVVARVPERNVLELLDDCVLGKEFVARWRKSFQKDGAGSFAFKGFALVYGIVYVYGARQFYKRDKASYDGIFLKNVKHPGPCPSFAMNPTKFSRYMEDLEDYDDRERRARMCAAERSLVWPAAIVWDAVFA